ncbi:MAG: cupin domain-containing protein, partial [Candidatus Puniceispirillaceae bacterium]
DLEEGDSFSFPTTITHNARNVTDEPCQLIWSISPVTIPRDVVISESRQTATKKAQG